MLLLLTLFLILILIMHVLPIVLLMLLLIINGSAEHWWIHQALDLPTKWWVLRSNKIPLLIEIRELIKAEKASQENSNRLPKQQGFFALLQVRSRIPFIQNFTTKLSLAVTSAWENKTGTLDWFLKGVGERQQ